MKKETYPLLRVKTGDLKPGMFVADVGRSWLHHPWKTKSKLISSPKDIALLVEHGITDVWVDPARSTSGTVMFDPEYSVTGESVVQARNVTAKSVARQINPLSETASPKTLAEVERRKQPRRDNSLKQNELTTEIPQAFQAYTRAIKVTRQVITEVQKGQKISMDLVRGSIDDMIDSVFRNRNALTALLKLKTYDEYTFTHSLNVAVVAISIGRHMDFSREQLLNLGIGAIFHDLGKTAIPDQILNKPGRLTDEEFEIMKTHPQHGEQILRRYGRDIPSPAFRIVRHHHERIDGQGYPDHLAENDMESYIIISGLSDVYDALTSARVYKTGMLPQKAMKIIFSMRDKQFPAAWVDRFIHCLGVYPIGTVVRLSTGEIGIVGTINQANLIRPQVIIAIKSNGQTQTVKKTVDLNQPSEENREITGVIDPETVGINPANYFPIT
jgi:putative nucleotidyltransferase with HDIG domain